MSETETVDLKRFPVVLVEWLDAQSWTEWRDVEGDFKLVPCRTVGHLIRETKEIIVVGGTIQTEVAHQQATLVGDTIAIPRSWVKSMKRLRC